LVTRLKTFGGPVLDGDVLDLGALEGDELDDRGVQGGGLELGGGAAFDVMHIGTLVSNDERALELTHVFRINTEICL